MYLEFMMEIVFTSNVIKSDFKNGILTPVSHSEALILYCLSKRPHSASSLAKEIDKDRSQTLRNLGKLSKDKLVMGSKTGGRNSFVLTQEGEKVVDDLKRSIVEFKKEDPELYSQGMKLLEDLKDFRKKATPYLTLGI